MRNIRNWQRSLPDRHVIETFGEKPFIPEVKEEAVTLNEKQEKIFLSYTSKAGQLMNTYIKGEERSFTIVAYPDAGDWLEV